MKKSFLKTGSKQLGISEMLMSGKQNRLQRQENMPRSVSEQKPTVPPKKGGTVIMTNTFHGPMPPPEMLAMYENVYPGFTERLFAQQEQESANRRKIEGDYSSGFKWTMLSSIWCATLICLALIGFAAVALLHGYAAVAISTIASGVVAFAAAFYKLRSGHKEDSE